MLDPYLSIGRLLDSNCNSRSHPSKTDHRGAPREAHSGRGGDARSPRRGRSRRHRAGNGTVTMPVIAMRLAADGCSRARRERAGARLVRVLELLLRRWLCEDGGGGDGACGCGGLAWAVAVPVGGLIECQSGQLVSHGILVGSPVVTVWLTVNGFRWGRTRCCLTQGRRDSCKGKEDVG